MDYAPQDVEGTLLSIFFQALKHRAREYASGFCTVHIP